MKGTLLVAAVLIGMLALTVGVAVWAWQEIGSVEIGLHGMIALGVGVGATLALGVGLMWLVYFSHRRGYDDRVGRD